MGVNMCKPYKYKAFKNMNQIHFKDDCLMTRPERWAQIPCMTRPELWLENWENQGRQTS